MATKFIVKIVNSINPVNNGKFWSLEGNGPTRERGRAHKYTRDELRNKRHVREAIRRECVLIPVQVEDNKKC